jgi:hypothetical protein
MKRREVIKLFGRRGVIMAVGGIGAAAGHAR